MQEKPRVGLVLMRANWLSCEAATPIRQHILTDTQGMVDQLSQHLNILGPWVVDSPEALQACQRALRDIDMDMALLAFQTWAEDTHLVSLLQAIGTRPLVVWCYLPWRRLDRPVAYEDVLRGSGPVGTFGALGTLRNLAVPFLFTFGSPDDPRLVDDLLVAGRAARMRRSLRSARFGLIPSRNDRIQSTFVDEFRLMADFGPVVQYISVEEYRKTAAALEQAAVDDYLRALRERYPVRGVPEATLQQAARAGLGLAQLANAYGLDVVAINDSSNELHRIMGLRPTLYPDLNGRSEVLYQPEGDLGAATANNILYRLTGSPTMFLEMWFWDEARNQMVGGHSGIQNPAIAEPDQVWIGPDYDFNRPGAIPESGCEDAGGVSFGGAQIQMIARPGRVTLFQLRKTPKGWQALAASGVCLEGLPWVKGLPHAILRLDSPINHFLNRLAEVGATQHWIMAYGSVMHELEAFCEMEKIPVELLSY